MSADNQDNDTTTILQEGGLRLYYIHQVGSGKVYHQKVASVDDAAKILNSFYELAQHLQSQRQIPDYSNLGGLEIYRTDDDGAGEWLEWSDDKYEDISAYIDDLDSESNHALIHEQLGYALMKPTPINQ